MKNQIAMITTEYSFIQAQLGFHDATARVGTLLRTREPAVRDNQPAATPTGFVIELPPQLTPSGTGDPPSQFPVAQHTGDVQILHHDSPTHPGQTGGEFV
jgi:hypothetical protein